MTTATNPTVATDLRAWLVSQPAITTLVGDRVFVDTVDEGEELPYIVLRRSGRSPEKDLAGAADYAVTTFDLEARANTQAIASAVSDTVLRLVDGYPQRDATTGELKNGRRWNGRDICYATCNDASNDYQLIPTGSWETDSIVALLIEVHCDG